MIISQAKFFILGAIIELAIRRVIHEEQAKNLSEEDIITIYRSLARLHLHERKYEKALILYINLRDKSVFHVIEKYNLFDMVIFQML